MIWLIGTGNGLAAELFSLNLAVCEFFLCVESMNNKTASVQTSQNDCSKVAANLNIHLVDPVSTKTKYREFHKAKLL